MGPSVSDRIIYWLLRLKLSQSELARRVGVDKSVISRWVNGVSVPTQGSLEKLCSAVGITLARFFGPIRARQGRRSLAARA